MPYVLVSTQVKLESGPCTIGDENSDPELMEYLGGKLIKQLGNNYMEWHSAEVPRVILERLEKRGYQVISCTGCGQTCIWTVHKPLEK